MSGRPSDTDQINGQPNTKPSQSAGRFFLKRFTYLRHISSILRHVRDVISGRGSPLVASVTVGWSWTGEGVHRVASGGVNEVFSAIPTGRHMRPEFARHILYTSRYRQILPGWKCFNKRIPGRGRPLCPYPFARPVLLMSIVCEFRVIACVLMVQPWSFYVLS